MSQILTAPVASTVRVRSSSNANKENEPGPSNSSFIRPKSGNAGVKPKPKDRLPSNTTYHFNGKQTFELSSPPANPRDAAQQALGLGLPLRVKSANARSTSSTSKGKDPVSCATIGRRKGRDISDNLGLKDAFADLPLEELVEDERVLANVTEAYIGTGGFHYSPSSTVSRPNSTSSSLSSSLKRRRPAYHSGSPKGSLKSGDGQLR